MANQQRGAFYGSVEEYVKARGGNRPIKKILVANNGIGAVKAIRSMRKWAYEAFGKERAVQFVAMATPEDLRANAEYIRMADEVVDVPGGNNSNNYANVMLIVEIAERWRVDAVWAGWGHASENPLLPDTLAATARKIVFIGPSGPPMRALGDKIGSTIIAQSAGVPTIAWNGDGLHADYADGGIPDDVYAKANVTTAEKAAEACERIGFPVMIKASEGGGGKGIRMVGEATGVAAAYRQVASEVPGSPIFVMRLAPRSRHLEVQLLADTYGEAIALNGRDCSVQRRHQKIIEEGPPVVASAEVWGNMERSAVQLAKKVGYCNAGTVEYLYSMDAKDFFFLELNPRLQVEHPVTEMITKVNLPAAQLQVAMGLPLHMIPDIRQMYGREPHGTDHIDFANEERPPAQGHCIAVRITAENPDQGFQPTSGTIKELNFRSTPDVWGYFSVDSSGLVHEFADSQFGHLFARGGDRETARRHMTVALKELSIRGDIRTTVEYIGEVLQSEDFIANRIDTGWLDVRIAAAKDGSLLATRMRKVDSHLAVVAGAVILAHEDVEKRTQTFLEMLGKGLLPPKELLATSKTVDLIYEGVKYSLVCCQAGPRYFTVTTLKGDEGKVGGGNALVEAQCRPLADGGYLLVIAGKSQVVYSNQEASGLRLSVNGNTCVFTKEYDPACLDTDVAGKLARRVVADGARVKEGEAYCEVEVMKMYMPLCVRESGVVRWHLSEGAALKPGDRLATLELDDPSAVTRAEVFAGVLSPAMNPETGSDASLSQSGGETSASATTVDDSPAGGDGVNDDSAEAAAADKPHVALRNAVDTLGVVLSGYAVPEMQSLRAIGGMRTSLADELLPYHELKEVLSVLSGKLDAGLTKKLQALADQYKAECTPGSGGDGGGEAPLFPAANALSLLDAHASRIADDRDRAAFWTTASDLAKVLLQHVQGPAGRASAALLQLIQEYLVVERSFAGVDMEDSLKALRKAYEGEEAIKVYDAFRSHAAIHRKNRLLLTLLDDIRQANAEAKAFLSKHRGGGLESSAEAAGEWGVGGVPLGVSRWAGLGAVEKLQDLDSGMESLLEVFPQYRGEAPACAEGAVNALHIVLLSNPIDPQDTNAPGRSRSASVASEGAVAAAAAAAAQAADDDTSQALQAALSRHREALVRADVRRVSFLSPRDAISGSTSILGVFTFRSRAGYKEDGLFRHIEPSHAFHLDLPRLSNFAICPANTSQLQGGNVHVYKATPKEAVDDKTKGKAAGGATRYFARAASEIAGRGKRYFMEQIILEALNGIDLAVAEAEDACIRAGRKESPPPPTNNHIFVNAVAPDPDVSGQDVAAHIGELMDRFEGKLQRLGVKQLEVKIVSCVGAGGGVLAPIRVVASNPTGYAVRVETYVEVSEGGKRVFRSLEGQAGGGARACSSSSGMKQGWDGREVGMPYPVYLPFEDKRLLAQARSETLYCFDFLELLEAGVQEQWAAYAKDRPEVTSTPSMVLHSRELVVRRRALAGGKTSAAADPWSADDLDDLEMVEVDRAAGLNDVGMVAWMLTLRTPEYPEGRQLVLIANDITHQAGSFGTREDIVFLLASRLSRARGLPRLYIAANSGARIGMAESLKKRFKVSWADPSDPTLGYRYLYLSREDYEDMKGRGAVVCEEVVDEDSGEVRFKILDVIGEEPDLGVENLQGSGRIAGETSSAYSDVFTLTLVLGRTVGIGAYLVRLGQRTIQKASASPILLTGYQALNTLMGREVYTSNEQLGGTGVMGPNGISHQVVDSHIGAVASALRWLSYVPSSRGSYLPVLSMAGVDDVEREVEFQPMKGVPCDPRHMIAGHDEGLDGSWTSGFFDKGSFTETLSGWAEAVVTGRARLGGIPVGVIATEGRLREKNCPADPADVTSHERIVQQAGGVWYPDSAHKTAQAIRDLNHEGLPLMVFANWRGFSGGQRDMFDEVLKYGALIVDALVEYKQPVFVYIPPHAELRGGAWVVVDSTVNANVMEMYAANGARGGVLEANGAASIKFRNKDLLKTAHRLDPVLMELDAKLSACTEEGDRRNIAAALAERETRVIGVYRQVAVQFADLHDTPGRMEARGAVRKVVPWTESRSFFFWRLRRRLAEFDLRRQVSRADPSVAPLAASGLLKDWYLSDAEAGAGNGARPCWEEDKTVLAWMENKAGSIKGHMEQLRFGRVSTQVSELASASPEAVLEGLLSAKGGLSKSARQTLLERLSSSS